MVFYGGGQTSSSASKKIAAILRAANHFDRLQLPKPYADLAGEPVWDVSEEQVAPWDYVCMCLVGLARARQACP